MRIFDGLRKFSDQTALIPERGSPLSYGWLLSTADRIAGVVKERSLVFALCRNCPESVAGYVGFLRAGIVPLLLNSTISQSFLNNLIDTYEPGYVFLPEDASLAQDNWAKAGSFGAYSLYRTDRPNDYELNENLALLLTTSGSTGSPKLVRVSNQNLSENARSIAQYLDISDTDRPITTMSMSYSYGLSILNSHLVQGAAVILTEATLMDRGFWSLLKYKEATTFGGVPYIYEMLKKLRFERMNLTSLRYLTQAGGKLSRELTAEFVELCASKGIEFCVMYGQTEATARMSYMPWSRAAEKVGSLGVAIPGGEFWLEDENREVIEEEHNSGELVYRGGNVTLGYAERLTDLAKSDENQGVLRTGDLARRDADGFYYIVGRKKRFIKMYGNRVNLDEIEQIFRAGGYDCVCAGEDEVLKIFTTEVGREDEILSFISERTALNRKGFLISCIDQIPRNESGKVQYAALI